MTEKSEKNTEKINRDKALDLALSQIEKQHGKGSIMRLGDERAYIPVEVIPTGALTLDVALGVGGLPRGRVTEIYGPEASGKTTLSLHVIANAQKQGGKAAFIDVEHALDPKYAKFWELTWIIYWFPNLIPANRHLISRKFLSGLMQWM